MSKQHYVVNCYTCQHNGQETCKGCNTLLVGDDEPYENWQLREDLESKDQKIADLEAKLAERTEQLKIALKDFNDIQQENDKLAQQLAEKEKEIESLRTRQFIDMTEKEMLELKIATHNQDLKKIRDIFKQSQNQTAIAVLKKVKKLFEEKYAYDVEESDFAVIYETDIDEIIDQQIRVLKGDK